MWQNSAHPINDHSVDNEIICEQCEQKAGAHLPAQSNTGTRFEDRVYHECPCTEDADCVCSACEQNRGGRMPNQPPYTVLATNPSRSSSVIYEIRRGADGVVYCDCPAWRCKGGKASCKHLDEWRRQNFSRPQLTQRDPTLSIQTTKTGDIVEVNSRGDVFLLKIDSMTYNATMQKVAGVELIDEGEAACSASGRREVDFRDVTRIVVKAPR